MDQREHDGLEIAARHRIEQRADKWLVPSQENRWKKYNVRLGRRPECDCVDFELTGQICKHVYAARFTEEREYSDDGTIPQLESPPVKIPRKTYSQNWPAYNAAQTHEKDRFQILLGDLCAGIEEHRSGGRGRPRIPLGDAIYSAVFKVYSTMSGRRFMSDLRESHRAGHISRVPCYNSIFNIFEADATTEILRSLVVESANPLKAIETNFACDSSGFAGGRFDRWYSVKWQQFESKRAWVKAHIMTGVSTNIVTAVEIHGQSAADSNMLKPLLDSTVARFNVDEVYGDLAYSSRANLQHIADVGATPLIPFKKNAVPTKSELWEKMYHYFHFKRGEFLERYHRRSNVESTFSMVKAKFGDGVRSKTDVAMKNEVLAKFVAHNICCLIQAMYELGVDPTFWNSGDSPADLPIFGEI